MSARSLVLFVAANDAGARTGNERTLCRLVQRLEEADVDVLVARPGEAAHVVVERVRATGRRPELVHAFHARRSGPRGVELATRLGVPLVVGLTGTDLVVDIFDTARAPVVLDVLRRANAVTCGNPDEAAIVARLVDPAPPCFVLPKGTPVPERTAAPVLPRVVGRPIVLQVAHLRRVKNVALAVRVVRRLADETGARLVVLGDVLDAAYEREVAREAGGDAEWRHVLHPAVSPERVGAYLASADIVLNTSDGEGGSNAVLEAMAHGCAVVASAVPGNVAYLGDDGVRGRTYPVCVGADGEIEHDEDALVGVLRSLLDDPAARARLGAEAREWVGREQSPEAERRSLLAVYATVAPAAFSL